MFCIRCGAANQDDASFCRKCGERLAQPPQEPRPEVLPPQAPNPSAVHAVAPKSGRAAVLTGASLAVAAVLVVIATLYLRYAEAQRKEAEQDTAQRAFLARDYRPLDVLGGQTAQAPADGAATTPAAPSEPLRSVEPSAAVPAPPLTQPARTSPPAAAPAQTAAPAVPSNSIVGRWKLTQVLGDTYLTFEADGHYAIRNLLGMVEKGLYIYNAVDGTLRMQDDSFFSSVTIWRCSVFGDKMTVLEGEQGAAHTYARVGG